MLQPPNPRGHDDSRGDFGVTWRMKEASPRSLNAVILSPSCNPFPLASVGFIWRNIAWSCRRRSSRSRKEEFRA